MPNLVDVNYKQTGKSLNTNNLGMREMQERAFEKKDAQYLLLKAPPASGKSRALMFLGLDKLFNQGRALRRRAFSAPPCTRPCARATPPFGSPCSSTWLATGTSQRRTGCM
mgnify:CR=1 FL=1